MKQILFILAFTPSVLFAQLLPKAEYKPEMFRTIYTLDTKRVSPYTLELHLEKYNHQAAVNFRQAKWCDAGTWLLIGGVAAGTIYATASKGSTAKITGYSIAGACSLLTIPLLIGSDRKRQKAVDLYNASR